MAVFGEHDLELSDPDRPERLTALRVSKDYFHVFGAAPAIGRDFQASDELPGNQRVVILSDALWKRRFSADRGIVRQKILLDSDPFTVIGVAPPGFEHCGGDYRSPDYGATVDASWPYSFEPSGRGSHFLNGVGRLKPGVTAAEASDDMNLIASDLGRTYHYTWRIFLVSLRDEIVGKSRRMLVVLLGAVAFVLLIACVNVAGLKLVRGTARSRDPAVRAALGASRLRLIGASVAESLILVLPALLRMCPGPAGMKTPDSWSRDARRRQTTKTTLSITPRLRAIFAPSAFRFWPAAPSTRATRLECPT
jgi:ABC-type antimicrobial peptide transport system permease subunit